MPVPELTTTIESQILSGLRQANDAVVQTVRTVAETVSPVVEALPDLPDLPFADQVPTTSEVVDNAFGFAEQVLATQRQFAKQLLAAVAPILDKVSVAAPAPAPARSTKTSSTKAA